MPSLAVSPTLTPVFTLIFMAEIMQKIKYYSIFIVITFGLLVKEQNTADIIATTQNTAVLLPATKRI